MELCKVQSFYLICNNYYFIVTLPHLTSVTVWHGMWCIDDNKLCNAMRHNVLYDNNLYVVDIIKMM